MKMSESDCKHCGTEEKKNILYEDEKVIAIVPEKPITKGHIQVIPKTHHSSMQDIDDKELEHLFYSASFSATSLFENLQAHGTNIIANTGGALKKGGHFHIDVLARMNGDDLNFLWKPQKVPEEELKDIQGKIKGKCDMIGVARKDKEVVDLDKKEVETIGPGQEDAPVPKQEPEKPKEPQKPSEDEKQSPEEPEQKGKEQESEEKKEGADKDMKKDTQEADENYLVKQLRRIP